MSAKQVFEEAFDRTPKATVWDPKWNAAEDYPSFLKFMDLGLAVGEMTTIVTPSPNNRKIVVVNIAHRKNLAVFERFTGGAHGVYVSVEPEILKTIFGSLIGSNLGEDMMLTLLGGAGNPNIGERLLKAKQSL